MDVHNKNMKNSQKVTGDFTEQELNNIENSGNPLTGVTNTFTKKTESRQNPTNDYDNV